MFAQWPYHFLAMRRIDTSAVKTDCQPPPLDGNGERLERMGQSI
jgi:hypothetical protein